MSDQQLVKDWMQRFGQETPVTPVIPSLEVRRLRAKLILEEALETIKALGFSALIEDHLDKTLAIDVESVVLADVYRPDLEAIADGCADLRVVTVGTEVACGIPGDKTFAEVMRSNDSKLWTHEEIESVPQIYWNSHSAKRILGSGRWLVKDKDGKVIKSSSYSPANLKPILETAKD